MELQILSAGAAKGLVNALEKAFSRAAGATLQASFGAVGAMKEKLLGGAPCDIVILTAALIDELAQTGHVRGNTSAALGRVRTGIAVRHGQPVPDISNRAFLKVSLLTADGIYLPDPQRATAGIHFVNVLKQLGIHSETEAHLRPYPNGATAMLELAKSAAPRLIGCTQITEINYTKGVMLVGPLPGEFDLSTVYSATVCTKARNPELAQRFVELLAGAESEDLREQGGFEC